MEKSLTKYDLLKQFFGHSTFRDGQAELIDAILSGRDAFGIMPTGGGKSICYQLPALMMEGVALVISPLISLMKDQVIALQNAGVSAAFVNSSLTSEQMKTVYFNLRAGEYKILYAAPERLDAEGFVSIMKSLKISLVAVDEAHCISQWGQDFRPSYLRIVDFLNKLPQRPVLSAFTATATNQVQDDIKLILKLRTPLCITTGFDRPNLNYEVIRPKNKAATLQTLIDQRRDKCGIVYCATRSAVEKVCDSLRRAGVSATRYHAGLTDEERHQNQENFLYDRSVVMVATNAFGMGIDKSNVGFVIHSNMPKSLEAYYQEAGRAGRDGEKADCILLYSAGDVQTAKFLIQNSGENEELSEEQRQVIMQRDYERLNAMIGYCKTTFCLRGYILEYFDQAHQESCGYCGNCRSIFEVMDITTEAQMILSCVRRARDKLGYSVGATLIVRTLCGSADQRVLELGLDQITTYGLLKGTIKSRIRELVEALEAQSYLHTDPIHGGVELTPKARNVLFHNEKVEITIKETSAPEIRHRKKTVTVSVEEENGLFMVLKALRFKIAQQEKVPAYIIFSNASLADMAAKVPRNITEFLEVSGVGEVKASRYGRAFLDEIKKYDREDI